MLDSRNCITLVVPFAEAIRKMTNQSSKVLSKLDYFYVTLSVFSIEYCLK